MKTVMSHFLLFFWGGGGGGYLFFNFNDINRYFLTLLEYLHFRIIALILSYSNVKKEIRAPHFSFHELIPSYSSVNNRFELLFFEVICHLGSS